MITIEFVLSVLIEFNDVLRSFAASFRNRPQPKPKSGRTGSSFPFSFPPHFEVISIDSKRERKIGFSEEKKGRRGWGPRGEGGWKRRGKRD